MKSFPVTAFFLLSNFSAFCQQNSPKDAESSGGLLLTALVAVIGYLAKSIYDLYLENRRKRKENIADKLKLFYWPVLIRLEKDNAIWETILSKRTDINSIQYKIANQVEKNIILENHQEILDVINNYAYLAEPGLELTNEIKKYIKNVAILKALRDSGEQKMFPFDLGAGWPEDLYPIIKERTQYYQNKLNEPQISLKKIELP